MIKIMKYGQISNDEIFARAVPTANVSDIVADIIADVRKNGDAAVLAYNRKFDGCDLTALEVSDEEIQQAFEAVEPKFLEILRSAADNIRAFHSK